MEIPEKLVRFKYHFLFSIIFSLILFLLFFLAPKFLTILAFFWPLYLSTALFLVAVVVFGRTSPPVTDSSSEVLMDYVAGQPERAVESYRAVSGQPEETEESFAEQPEEAVESYNKSE